MDTNILQYYLQKKKNERTDDDNGYGGNKLIFTINTQN